MTVIANMKTLTKLMSAFLVIIVVSIVVNVTSLISSGTQRDAAFWTDHTHKVLATVESMIMGMVNQETGVRGYLLAGDKGFLEPVASGEQQFKKAFDEGRALTSDNAVQQKRFADLGALVAKWEQDVRNEELRLMEDPATVDQARAMEISGAGKTYMDAIRKLAGEISAEEAGLLSVRDKMASDAADLTRWTIIIGLVAMLAITCISLVLLNQSLIRPIRAITESMGRLAGGDTQSEIPYAGRKDEVGDMAGAIEVFRQNALTTKRLEDEANANRTQSEKARAAEEERAAREAQNLRFATTTLGENLKRLADGDLTCTIQTNFASEYESLRTDFNTTVSRLSEIMGAVMSAVHNMDSGTREISEGASDLSRRTEQQAASLEETAAAVDEITTNVTNSSKITEEARGVAQAATRSADQSVEVVSSAEQAMRKIEESSQQISNIIGVIDEIAFQTNLLALNAGVEAARAGEAGKGFAVVAQEVRELAQRSAQAAKEIKALIQNSNADVDSGVKLVRDTGEALKTIGDYITKINSFMESIATSSREQSVGLSEVNVAVNQMDQTTQQNAAMVEQSTAAAASLAQEAGRLGMLVSKFKVDGLGAAAPAVSARQSTASARPSPARGVSRPASSGNLALKTEEWSEF
ncbi:methyl-accepting chemotaxis protein [Ciceribacter sp. L1K22]|uniref:methyl-accepting chemotaxis protein n=1 Tax=Ciceribacter sp. L1K22 TaxID=2820275 RepID=UPI0032B199F3